MNKNLWCWLGWHIWEPVYRDGADALLARSLIVEHRCAVCGKPDHDDSALLKSLFRND